MKEGQKVDTSLFEAGIVHTYWQSAIAGATGESPGPLGSAHPLTAPYQAFKTKDKWITVGASGEEKDLMIDVNRAWDLKTAIEGVKEFKKFKPTWIEEPLRWEDDRRTLKLLSKQTDIPISGGEI